MLEVFNAADADRSGTIDQQELTDILESVPGLTVTPEVVTRIFERLDTTGSGSLNFYDFAPLAYGLLSRESNDSEDGSDADDDDDDEDDDGDNEGQDSRSS